MNSIGAYMPQSSLAIDHIDYVNVYVVYVIYVWSSQIKAEYMYM